MTLEYCDLLRAIRGGGDISSLVPVYAAALGCEASRVCSDLQNPTNFPSEYWQVEGKTVEFSLGKRKPGQSNPLSSIQLTLLAFSPGAPGLQSHLSRVLAEVAPDIVAIDSFPSELRAHQVYAFSLACALGLAAHGQVVKKESGESYFEISLIPGDISEGAILESHLKNIPLLPIAAPPRRARLTFVAGQGYFDLNQIEGAGFESGREDIYSAYGRNLAKCSDSLSGLDLARKTSKSLLASLITPAREDLTNKACYLASRILDIAYWAARQSQSRRVLVLVELSHLPDLEYALDLLEHNIFDETYFPFQPDIAPQELMLIAKCAETADEYFPQDLSTANLGQRLFIPAFNAYVNSIDQPPLAKEDSFRLISEIVRRSRQHPEISRGASVRASLAFQEIAESLSTMEEKLSAPTLQKAASITLTPRVHLKKAGNPKAVVEDLVKEVLYNISFLPGKRGESDRGTGRLAGPDILRKLHEIESAPQKRVESESGEKSPSVVVESDADGEQLKSLEKRNMVQKDEEGRYSLTRKALEYLLKDLDRKLESGEITQAEHKQQKSRLMGKIKSLSRPRTSLSKGEIANTIMEMIDAQDRQWNSGINFNTMHVYYHIKDTAEGAVLSPQKRDYFALKRLIDDMEKRSVLTPAENSAGLVLTGLALDLLLKHLLNQGRKAGGERLTGRGPRLASERISGVRRYSSGDAFRDISFRQTLREVARQRKSLGNIAHRDLRVRLKESRKPKLDLMLCLDISGSMGFSQKLMYARLAAAGLIQAALKEGHRVGIVAFNDRGHVSLPLSEGSGEELLDRIAGLTAKGNTNIGDGIRASRELLCREASRNEKQVILISDGQASAISEKAYNHFKGSRGQDLTRESALFEVRAAVAKGIQLSVIHIAAQNEPSDAFMKDLARAGNGNLQRISRPEDLESVLGS